MRGTQGVAGQSRRLRQRSLDVELASLFACKIHFSSTILIRMGSQWCIKSRGHRSGTKAITPWVYPRAPLPIQAGSDPSRVRSKRGPIEAGSDPSGVRSKRGPIEAGSDRSGVRSKRGPIQAGSDPSGVRSKRGPIQAGSLGRKGLCYSPLVGGPNDVEPVLEITASAASSTSIVSSYTL